MDVQCERCKTEYEFDDALVSGRGTTVRCTNCGHQFKVRSHEATDPGSDQWLVHTGTGHRLTFVSLRELQRAILAKQVARGDVLVRGAAPPRSLGSIAELEPFFEGKASNRPPQTLAGGVSAPPPMTAQNAAAAGAAGSPVSFPKRTAQWSPEPSPAPFISRVPAPNANHGAAAIRRTDPFGLPTEQARAAPTDSSGQAPDSPGRGTLRPPPGASAAPPPPRMRDPQAGGYPVPQTAGALGGGGPPSGERVVTTAIMDTSASMSRPQPPPSRPRPPVASERELPPMRLSSPSYSEEDAYGIPRRRRVGGWVVALVLLLAAGVGGWGIARPYLLARSVGATARLDPRALQFVVDGERAMSSGDLDSAQEAFDKASALAERDPRVLVDKARVSAARADVAWLKLRLLPPEATDESRATRLQLDEAVARARRAADEALAVAPADDPTALRARIDALRLAGDKDAARASVSRVVTLASQPETAYVLAALDLAEPDPLWNTVIDRLRTAAAGEGIAGRARAALVYALARSGDTSAARGELTKMDAAARPYPLVPALRAFVDKAPSKPAAGPSASAPRVDVSALPSQRPPAAAAEAPAGVAAAPAVGRSGGGNGDEASGGPTTGGMQAASQAIKRGDWGRARQIYEALVARDPNDSEALSGIGDVDRAQGNMAGAIGAYKRALAVNPSYMPALLGVADTQWASGNRAEATRAYKEIADRFPEGTYPAYVKTRADENAASPGGAKGASPGEREGL
jgi:predicted Zn finger-like uncharacterized protein